MSTTLATPWRPALLIPVTLLAVRSPLQGGNPHEEARRMLEATGVRGGLVVHLGCGDGTLTAALRENDRYLVHGLDVEGRAVAEARQHIQSLGLAGPVSADTFDGQHLPYADNLANPLVAEDLGNVAMAEVKARAGM